MSADEKLIPLIKTAFVQLGESRSKYQDIKEGLKGHSVLPENVVKHLIETLSKYDHHIMPKAFNFIDYLSSVYPQKMVSLSENEEFLEKLFFLVFEPQFKTKVLSLAKYWSLMYDKLKISYPNLHKFIDNLAGCGFDLPKDPILLYCEKDRSDLKPDPIPYEADEENPMMTENYSYQDMLNKAIETAPPDLLNQPQPITTAAENITAAKPQKNESNHQKNKQPFVAAGIPDDVLDYPNVMTKEELLKYKTKRCTENSSCPNKPHRNTGKEFRNASLMCPNFHSITDRRRQVYKNNKQQYSYMRAKFEYSSKTCKYNNCASEYCGNSHNFFEIMFHPSIYKRYECNKEATPACIAGKYCPYYHTIEEKNAWDTILSLYFEIERKKDPSEMPAQTSQEMETFESNAPVEYESKGVIESKVKQSHGNHHHSGSKPTVAEPIEYVNVKGVEQTHKEFIDPKTLKVPLLTTLLYSPYNSDPNYQKKLLNGETKAKIDSKENYIEKYNTTIKFGPKQLFDK